MNAGDGLNLAALVFQPPGFGLPGSLVVALSVAAAVLAYTAGLRWRQQGQPVQFGLLGLRLGALLCLFLTLLHPAWVSERVTDEKPVVAVVLDDSGSMAGSETTNEEGEDNPTRYARAVAVLQEELTPALEQTHRLRLYDVEGRTLRADDLPPAPAAQRSPLTDTLLQVQRDVRADVLAGIVLLSDGAETDDRPTVGGLEQLRVPVYTIDVCGEAGSGAGGPDLAIQAVSTNRRALVGNVVRVTVDVTLEGRLADEPPPGDRRDAVRVALLDGDKTVASQRLRWDDGPVENRSHRRVELEFVPRRPGEFTHTVSVGGLPNEADLGNNRATFPLTVAAKPLTVLYIDGVLRWEGKFVREALAADPDTNLVSSVRTARVGADHGSQGLLLAEQLANVDVVILGDVEATYFSTGDELAALAAWVTDGGGGLVLTGGYHSFGPEGFGRTALRDILPVEFSAAANPQIEQPFSLRLTDAGREHPTFHLSGDRLRDTTFFHKLPPLDGCSRIAGVKPGAEVLAVNPQVTGPDGTQGLPVLVVQQVGAGRTMVFAVDTTWRWRTIVGGFTGDSSFYERFWGQLVRWMASEEDEQRPQLLVRTNRSRYRLGQTIELDIDVHSKASIHRLETGATGVSARALDESGRATSVPLADLGGGKYRGRLAARQPGRLDLTVTAEPAADSDAEAQSQVITVEIQRPDPELRHPRPDPQWLTRVSQVTGGRLLKPGQIQTLAAGLPADPVPTRIVRTSGAWGDWLFGSAFVLLLCAEWILRRRSQLA